MADRVEIHVTSRVRVAGRVYSRSRGAEVRSLISIGDPGRKRPAGFLRVENRLRLEFEDVSAAHLGMAPTPTHVESLIAFAPAIARAGGVCVVHCEAGVSRSPAAAIIVLTAIGGPGSEEESVERVLRGRPQSIPNRLMIEHADALLGRDGALVRAVERSELRYAPIDLGRDLSVCLAFRRDEMAASFGPAVQLDEPRYIAWLEEMRDREPFGFVHVWRGGEIVGQLELGRDRRRPSRGCVELVYLVPERRGTSDSVRLSLYTDVYLRTSGVKWASLTVSPNNGRALRYYQKHGWLDAGPDPERPEVRRMTKCLR